MPETFTLHEVAGGVWMAKAPGTVSAAVSNAALIDLGDRTVVVDTFMTTRAARELAAESARLTGRKPYLVVNSHWHSDHVGGNRAFRDVPIVGTERMRELMIHDAPASREEFEKAAAETRRLAANLRAAGPGTEEAAQAAGIEAMADALVSDKEGHRVVLPGVLVQERLELVGDRTATVLTYGRGHTESDLFVHIPDASVLIAGDLVWTGVHPKTNDGFPLEWASVLGSLEDLGARVVVPGHGPPGTSESIATMQQYMNAVATLLDQVRSGKVDPADVEVPPVSRGWADPERFRTGLGRLAEAGSGER
jgi:glyoxylase-like metal-dependent hydrolase (beta-lactamase superfamily II)